LKYTEFGVLTGIRKNSVYGVDRIRGLGGSQRRRLVNKATDWSAQKKARNFLSAERLLAVEEALCSVEFTAV